MEEKKKQSLLRYIAIMFVVAFVLVLISLIGQTKNISELNKSSVSALQNAEQLQEDNRRLQEQVVSLTEEKLTLNQTVQEQQDKIDELEKLLEETKQTNEQLQQAYDELAAQILTQEEVDEQ